MLFSPPLRFGTIYTNTLCKLITSMVFNLFSRLFNWGTETEVKAHEVTINNLNAKGTSSSSEKHEYAKNSGKEGSFLHWTEHLDTSFLLIIIILGVIYYFIRQYWYKAVSKQSSKVVKALAITTGVNKEKEEEIELESIKPFVRKNLQYTAKPCLV